MTITKAGNAHEGCRALFYKDEITSLFYIR